MPNKTNALIEPASAKSDPAVDRENSLRVALDEQRACAVEELAAVARHRERMGFRAAGLRELVARDFDAEQREEARLVAEHQTQLAEFAVRSSGAATRAQNLRALIDADRRRASRDRLMSEQLAGEGDVPALELLVEQCSADADEVTAEIGSLSSRRQEAILASDFDGLRQAFVAAGELPAKLAIKRSAELDARLRLARARLAAAAAACPALGEPRASAEVAFRAARAAFNEAADAERRNIADRQDLARHVRDATAALESHRRSIVGAVA